MDSMNRHQALAEIVRLMGEHGISHAELTALKNEKGDAAESSSNLVAQSAQSSVLVRVLGGIGATFVVAGLVTFVGMHWESLGSLARVTITLLPGIAAVALGVIALGDARFRGLAPGFLTVGGLLEPTGLLVAFDEFGGGGDSQLAVLITTIVMSIQFGALSLRYGHIVMAAFTVFFVCMTWGNLLDMLDFDEQLIAITLGVGLLATAIHFHRGRHEGLSPTTFLAGAWILMWGVFDWLEGSAWDIAFLGLACALVYLGVRVKSRTLNFAATIGILAYVGYFTSEHFVDSVGWPLALIGFGILLIVTSGLAIRIDRRYIRH